MSLRFTFALIVAASATARAEKAAPTSYSSPTDINDGYQAPVAQYNEHDYMQGSYNADQQYYQGASSYSSGSPISAYDSAPVEPLFSFDDSSLTASWISPGLFLASGVVLLAVLGVITIGWLPIRSISMPLVDKIVDSGSRAFGDLKSFDDLVQMATGVDKAIEKAKSAYENLTGVAAK